MAKKGSTKSYGELGEEYAVKLLKKQGYKILERNFRAKFGEIDIVAIDPSTGASTGLSRMSSGPEARLVFVEVKTRWSKKYGAPEEAVTPKKLYKIKRVGEYFSQRHPTLPKKLRVDVVAIEVEKGKVTSAKIIKVD